VPRCQTLEYPPWNPCLRSSGPSRLLGTAVELLHTPFLAPLIPDLTHSDPYHVIPVVLGGSSFLQQKLMPAAVAFDKDGNASPALLKKLASLGFGPEAVPSLKRLPDGKAESLFVDTTVAGATLAEGLQKAIDETLAKLPIPKVMTYQLADGWTDVKFVRPAHSLVALHGADVVPVQALGLASGNTTGGHRFEAKVDPVRLIRMD